MRKFLLALCFALVAYSVFAGSYTTTITNRMMILGPTSMKPLGTNVIGLAYANSTAYTKGQIVTANSKIYFVVDAGTSASSGTGPGAAGEVVDGTVRFFQCLSSDRNLYLITHVSGGTVTLQGYGDLSSTNYDGAPIESGWRAGEGQPGCWQGAVYAVGTGAVISVLEH